VNETTREAVVLYRLHRSHLVSWQLAFGASTPQLSVLNMLIDDKLSTNPKNPMITSPRCVRLMSTPDDNFGSDNYHRG
jgi:hypothetical protein